MKSIECMEREYSLEKNKIYDNNNCTFTFYIPNIKVIIKKIKICCLRTINIK
jgi:hypothetical protein